EEELAGGRIAPQANVLAGDIGESIKRQVGPIVATAAADDDLVLRHPISLAAALIFVLDGGVGVGIVLLRGLRFAAQTAGADPLGQGAGAIIGLGGNRQLGVDYDVAGLDLVFGVFQKLHGPATGRSLDFGIGLRRH